VNGFVTPVFSVIKKSHLNSHSAGTGWRCSAN
jgi:hypothetical protein